MCGILGQINKSALIDKMVFDTMLYTMYIGYLIVVGVLFHRLQDNRKCMQ